ncbi:MAG: Rrf2 family transcriptional regulator [Pseudomonadales bacterium]|nr:Rrf2 family transcriptional regulator [Pseudomonadales bacterium]
MQLTTRGRYAVTAMLDLALLEDSAPIRLADIAQRQGISLSYLEQLFAQLRRNGLVESVRGPGGGYRLARKNHLLSVSDIIDSVNERIDATRCDGRGDCQQGATCLTHHLWVELSENLHEFLRGITIADLIRDNAARMDHTTSEQSVADV